MVSAAEERDGQRRKEREERRKDRYEEITEEGEVYVKTGGADYNA